MTTRLALTNLINLNPGFIKINLLLHSYSCYIYLAINKCFLNVSIMKER